MGKQKPTQPEPNLKTPEEQYSKVDQIKFTSKFLQGNLKEEFRDLSLDNIEKDSAEIAKSHGIYLEHNRAKTGKEKDWIYMIRISIPGGGPITSQQWAILDDLAEKFTVSPEGIPSLRLTTRQNIQLHWVRKQNLIPLIQGIAGSGYFTLNGCGDNTRNVMGCPFSRYSDIFDANAWAQKVGKYFRLPAEPHIQIFGVDPEYVRTPEEHFKYRQNLLNRKFKIAFSAVQRDENNGQIIPDNCVEALTNDVAVTPIIENEKLQAFQVFIGGGQGEKNSKPSFAAQGKPFGIFTPENLLQGLDAIVKTHQEWGDRQNRHWARLKYVVYSQGVDWFRDQVNNYGITFDNPIPDLDPGPRMLHHGWLQQPVDGKYTFGAFIENGRLKNQENGTLKSMVRYILDKYDNELLITPNQDLLFSNLEPEARKEFENDLASFGFGKRNGKPYSKLRLASGACVGLHTCKLAYTESENFLPEIIDELESRGYGELAEAVGITGCEAQCFRPATKTVGWVGQGPNMYALKIGGSEDARQQGTWLADEEGWYLRRVPREEVANVTAALMDYYLNNRKSPEEGMGEFQKRKGHKGVINYLKNNDKTAHLMEKPSRTTYMDAQRNKYVHHKHKKELV